MSINNLSVNKKTRSRYSMRTEQETIRDIIKTLNELPQELKKRGDMNDEKTYKLCCAIIKSVADYIEEKYLEEKK